MMKKRLLMSLAVLMGLTSAMATDVITSNDFSISRGETKTFSIKLSNEVTNYVGFQMDLTLPEGLTINKTCCSLSARVADENQVLTIGKQSDNTYRLTSTSLSLTPISGTSGDLINVSVTASNTYQSGNASISNIQFATSNSERVTMNNVALDINVAAISFADNQVKALCVSNWDTNGDGELDEAEAAAVTDLGEVFMLNSNITSFDELQYFTGLTSIGDYAFSNCSILASINIPKNVTTIGNNAFFSCCELSSITIPESVTSIGSCAFVHCSSLTSIKVESGNTRYDSRDNCNAIIETENNSLIAGCQNSIIPNSVTNIGDYAFRGCSGLTSVTISESVSTIGEYAFYYCSGLTSITIPSSVASINRGAFCHCDALTSIIIPESVTSISESTFNSCSNLISVTIPEGLTYIGSSAFYGCSSLTSVTIPEGVMSIGDYAFHNCSNLISITIPEGLTYIGSSAFSRCSGLTSVTIPKSVTNIGNGPFEGCSGLASIKVESGNANYDSRDNCNAIIETDSNKLISGCDNTTIPSSVTSIGNRAFLGISSLTSITIPEGVTSIGDYAFSGCSALTSITIPEGVTSINEDVFRNCSSLTSVTIPESVTSIGNSAFKDCSCLTSITIPYNVTIIEGYAFSGCYRLTSVIVHNSSPLAIDAITFNYRTNATLYVPKDSKPAYAEADYWKEFKAIKEFPDPDVNQNGYVDVVDVVDVARFVVGTPSESFDEFLADLNGSGEVNVADAVVLVNEIAGDVNWSRPMRAQAVSDGMVTLTRNTDESLSFSLEGNSAYTAFQFDLMMPEGMDVTQMTLNNLRMRNHQLLYNELGEGHYRIVALSTSNQSFNGSAGELLCMAFDDQPTDDIVIDNIHFVTPQGNDLLFSAIGISDDTPTNISVVKNDPSNSDGTIYNLNGQRLTKAQKGLYIINGKKVLVK